MLATTRRGNAALLDGVPGLHVPRIALIERQGRAAEDLAGEIGRQTGYPVILRLPGAHQGSKSLLSHEWTTVVKCDDAASVVAHLEQTRWDRFYAIEFVDLKRPDGFYRKIRAVVVGSELIVIKPSIYHDWMVAGWRSRPEGIAFMLDNRKVVEECNRIALDPVDELGAPALGVLAAIGERLPLDIFGIDFELAPDGRIVFFEAGAAMTFDREMALEPEDVRLPPEPFAQTDAAVHRFLVRKIAGAARPG